MSMPSPVGKRAAVAAVARAAGSVYNAGRAGVALGTGQVHELKQYEGKVSLFVNVASL
jgi:hypothetical protein